MEKDIAIEQERNARYRPPKILEPTAFQEPPPKVSQVWASSVLRSKQSQVPSWPDCPLTAQGACFFTILFQFWTQTPTIHRCPLKRNLGPAHSPWESWIKNCPLVPCGSLCSSRDGRSGVHYDKEWKCPEPLTFSLYVHASMTALGSGSRTVLPHHHMVGFPETRPVLARAGKTKKHRQNDLNNKHPSLTVSEIWKSTAQKTSNVVSGEVLWSLFSSSL